MSTLFDGFLIVGILLAMGMSSEPKKSAIAVILYASLLGRGLDYFFDGWIVMNMASIVESMGAILLLAYARKLEYKDRIFFRMMSTFLLASAALVPLYKYDIIVLHGDYVAISHAIALTHLTFMLIFSDGFGIVARNLRNNLLADWGYSADS